MGKVSERHWMSEWRSAVLNAARGRCELCGKPAAHAHHIISRRIHSLRYDQRNGYALCHVCHAKHHDRSSRPVNDMLEQKRPADLAWCRRMKSCIKIQAEIPDISVDW